MKRVFSGIQPSGIIHIGNYLGALKNWVALQDKYECLFSVVDLHAMTVYQEPLKLRQQILSTAKTLLAFGINPKKSTLFVQSDVPEHLELYWTLNTIAKVGELELMTQYKDRVAQGKGATAGLLNYPVLMAADILLYNADAVPIGEDQKQHLEIARELARRFNALYEKTFTVPEPLIQKTGARIMGLDDPTKKMSKSASSPYNYIALTDSPAIVRNKIQKAVTDSGKDVTYNPVKKPGISNLLTILSLTTDASIATLQKRYAGSGYGIFKKDVAEAVVKFLSGFQKRYEKTSDTQAKKVVATGAARARRIAAKKIEEVYRKVGLE